MEVKPSRGRFKKHFVRKVKTPTHPNRRILGLIDATKRKRELQIEWPCYIPQTATTKNLQEDEDIQIERKCRRIWLLPNAAKSITKELGVVCTHSRSVHMRIT